MSETKKTEDHKETAKPLDPEELVGFTAPIDPTGRERDILLAVNGESIRVKRGSTVQIKRKFVECFQHSVEQKNAAYRAMEAAAEGGKDPILEL